MTFRCALFVTVATRGPRTAGSAAPHTIGIGFGPWPPGCDVRTMALGCFLFGFSAVAATSLACSSSRHPAGVGLKHPLGGDLLQIAPELHPARPGDVAVPELGFPRPPERE